MPALRATTGEMDSVLSAADGGFVPPGPSGAPSRGMAHVLPTGRNFYSLDPKAVPSRLSMEVGEALAARLCERHVAESGELPKSVAIVVWGTAVMRTGGDDVAEALALLGVRPVWSEESGRVEGLQAVPLSELGRARVDVTLRVSGFFRDAFPHVIALVDDAIELVAALDEPADLNYVRAAGTSTRGSSGRPRAPMDPASCRSSRAAIGRPTTTSQPSTSPGQVGRTGVKPWARRPARRWRGGWRAPRWP